MRNLHLYPVNNGDRIAVLKELRAEYEAKMAALPPEKVPIGGMTGVVLDDLVEFFEGRKERCRHPNTVDRADCGHAWQN